MSYVSLTYPIINVSFTLSKATASYTISQTGTNDYDVSVTANGTGILVWTSVFQKGANFSTSGKTTLSGVSN